MKSVLYIESPKYYISKKIVIQINPPHCGEGEFCYKVFSDMKDIFYWFEGDSNVYLECELAHNLDGMRLN